MKTRRRAQGARIKAGYSGIKVYRKTETGKRLPDKITNIKLICRDEIIQDFNWEKETMIEFMGSINNGNPIVPQGQNHRSQVIYGLVREIPPIIRVL